MNRATCYPPLLETYLLSCTLRTKDVLAACDCFPGDHACFSLGSKIGLGSHGNVKLRVFYSNLEKIHAYLR